MRKAEEASHADSQGDVPEPDEEFLMRVDRAMLAFKQSDPHRLEQVRRATEEETRLAIMTNAHRLEQRPGHGRAGMR
jgi:hypothetical protein